MESPVNTTRENPVHTFRDSFDRGVVDTAFLWSLRSIAVEQPNYSTADLAELEVRIDDQLDFLMSAPDIGWTACEAALSLQQPGETFAAAVIALRSHDVEKIKIAVQNGLSQPNTFPGLASALGWLPAELARPWVERFLKGKDMNHKHLGVAACSLRRENPGEILNDILSREDCRAHSLLHARALRLVGELRRQDLMPMLQKNLGNADATAAFWANWSGILLGQHALVTNLQPITLTPGPFQARAIQLAFRALPVKQGREWISALAKNSVNARAVISATGVLGDPHAVNWLISKMPDPALARLAGEAFTLITGIELDKHGLTLTAKPPLAIPNNDPKDSFVGLDEDEHLPWPDAEKIAALWRNHGQHFLVGRRYLLGKPISPDWLKQILVQGYQRQRHAAALELALIDSQSRLVNTRARAGA